MVKADMYRGFNMKETSKYVLPTSRAQALPQMNKCVFIQVKHFPSEHCETVAADALLKDHLKPFKQ